MSATSARPHFPVMLPEVLTALNISDDKTFIDGTFGAGGYSRAILRAGQTRLIAIDRDPNVVKTAESFDKEFGERFRLYQGTFSQLDAAANGELIHGVVLDIGVSSMQLDQAERGFSFMRSGPLDMRMSGQGLTAADAVNYLQHNDLIRIFQVYGEERRARRCADFIVRFREDKPFETTQELAELMEQALGRGGKIHPATRVFQALRIFINDELGELYRALVAAEQVLQAGGRLVVVTFHSLEDKIVKAFFRSRAGETKGRSRHLPPDDSEKTAPSFTLSIEGGSRSVVKPSKSEVEENPRSRSAKLRVGQRTDAPVWDIEDNLLPRAPSLDDLSRSVQRAA